MAHKSKTQRAKATAAKANRREREERDVQSAVAAEVAKGVTEEEALEKVLEVKKAETKPEPITVTTKEPEKPKKKRFQFIKDVRAEMKRVTWPTRTDVLRWSGVVVAALVFFGVYVAILDNLIVTPALVALSGLGA